MPAVGRKKTKLVPNTYLLGKRVNSESSFFAISRNMAVINEMDEVHSPIPSLYV